MRCVVNPRLRDDRNHTRRACRPNLEQMCFASETREQWKQFSSTCRDSPLNVVKDRLVTWLLQSGMDYLLTSDFHPLSTPSNAVWKLTFSNSPSTPLPCCSPSDCQRLWFSTTTECARVIDACIIMIMIIIIMLNCSVCQIVCVASYVCTRSYAVCGRRVARTCIISTCYRRHSRHASQYNYRPGRLATLVFIITATISRLMFNQRCQFWKNII